MRTIKPSGTKLDFRVFEKDLLGSLTAEASDGGYSIDLRDVEFFDLSGIVPLISLNEGLVHHGCNSEFLLPSQQFLVDYMTKAGWIAAITGHGPPASRRGRDTYSRLHSFTSGDGLNAAVNDAIEVLAGVSEFPAGVLSGIQWTLVELTDNVLVHAGGAPGWMQVVSRPKNNHVHIVIADAGEGIVNTIREGYPDTNNDCEALGLAVTKGVTRNRSIGQGNGLAGSLRIAEELKGYVNIMSGGAALYQAPGLDTHIRSCPKHPGTVVCLTVSTDSSIEVSSALWGHEPSTPFEMTHIEFDGIVFNMAEEASAFGNRATGDLLVNKLRNIAVGAPDQKVIIDFAGVDIASASFLDEFLAKLVKREGVSTYFARYSLRNMNELVRRTADHVISQRLAVEE